MDLISLLRRDRVMPDGLCADGAVGTPSRFASGIGLNGSPLSCNPAAPQELERAGDLVARLPTSQQSRVSPATHGYVLFSTTGKWVVSIAVKSQRVGSFVVNVTSG